MSSSIIRIAALVTSIMLLLLIAILASQYAALLGIKTTSPPTGGTSASNSEKTTAGGFSNTNISSTSNNSTLESENITSSGCRPCSLKDNRPSLIDSGISSAEGGKGAETPLFQIYGLPKSPYLRTSVGEVYQSGRWFPLSSGGERYSGGIIYTPSLDSEIWSIKVVPLVEIGGYLPVMRETCEIEIGHELTRFPSELSFYLNGTTTQPYTVIYTPEVHDEKSLQNAKCREDKAMLQLPPSITNLTRELAANLTRGIARDYDKVIAIRDYLVRNYVYDENYNRAPAGWDPVEWFLFKEKRGVCANFNSAFAILCRAAGIPARVVHGYLIRTDVANQTVKEKQAHCWAEVEFEGIGWVTFDATGRSGRETSEETSTVGQLPKRVKTVTRITSQPSTAIRGETVLISGTVRTVGGSDVSGLPVFLYIMENKTSPARIIGVTNVTNGIFKIAWTIPTDHPIGHFLIVAKTGENEYYVGSTSDPPITVMSRTKLSIDSTDLVTVGKPFEIYGKLLESETGAPISNAKISIKIEGVTISSAKTDLAGIYHSFISINRTGNYTIYVSYPGDELRLPCEMKTTIRVVSTSLNWEAETSMIRGEPWSIKGRVVEGGEGVGNAEVILELDGSKISTTRTDSYGNFAFIYEVPKDISLGTHTVSVTLPSYGLSSERKILISAKTKIIVGLPEEVERGKSFLLNASLMDDLNQPIANEELNIKVSSKVGETFLKRKTDRNGFLSINLTAPTDQSLDAIAVEMSFPGSGYYLGSRTYRSVKVRNPDFSQALLLTGAIIILMLSIVGLIRRRRKSESREVKETELEGQARKLELVEKTEVQLAFPSISDPFPLVWGVNEPLTVNLICTGPIQRDFVLELMVDGNKFLSKECQHEQSMTLNFPLKGEHSILARVVHGNGIVSEARATVRIVDYREEISSMHNDLVNEMEKAGISLEGTLTLREELDQILHTTDKVDSEALSDFYSILEKVNYSSKSISRSDYERAYLLLLSIKSKLASSKVGGE